MSKFIVYKAKDGWRWRLKASNGRVIADGGEAYKRKPTSKLADKIYEAFHNAEYDETFE